MYAFAHFAHSIYHCISCLTPGRVKLTPHMLCHTFLKRITDQHGVHIAQKLSGNISMRGIIRYAKPIKCSIDESVEHHPLLEELKEVYRKNSIDLLVAALKVGSLCDRTSITEEDIKEYSKHSAAL